MDSQWIATVISTLAAGLTFLITNQFIKTVISFIVSNYAMWMWLWKKTGHYWITLPRQKDEMKRKIQNFYKDAILPQVVWQDQNLSIEEYFETLDLQRNNRAITIEELFKECKLHGILIEGQPGMGKSSIVNKIAYDWAVQKVYLKEFDLVFAIQLSAEEEGDILNALFKTAKKYGFPDDKDSFNDLLKKYEQKTLILIDGYDELRFQSKELRKSVDRVFCKEMFSNATVVLTCRSGMFGMMNNPLTIPTCRPNRYDKIILRGLGRENRKKLLEKFHAEHMIAVLDNARQNLEEICKSPLVVTLFGVLKENLKKVNWEEITVTTLYRKIFNGLVRRYHFTKNVTLEDDFDFIEKPSNECELTSEKLIEFCKHCYNFLKESNNKFKNDKFFLKMYEFGFLIKIETRNILTAEVHFEPFHRSFAEYLAAVYIWQKGWFLKNIKPKPRDIAELRDHFNDSDLLLQFLSELTGIDVQSLLARSALIKKPGEPKKKNPSWKEMWSKLKEFFWQKKSK